MQTAASKQQALGGEREEFRPVSGSITFLTFFFITDMLFYKAKNNMKAARDKYPISHANGPSCINTFKIIDDKT